MNCDEFESMMNMETMIESMMNMETMINEE